VAFGLQKLAVLESKLDIYEDLSKEMLDKLERAVGTISESSNRVAVILERHEGRLDDSEKTDQLLLKMFDEMKAENRRDHQVTAKRIEALQKKVEQNQRFVIGATAVLATIVTVLQVAPPIIRLLTQPATAATMEVVKPL
jgi:DNA-directed RNA polymerase beta' subunit